MKVNLWFARENDNEIVGILNSNSNNEYSCPICSSKVIPKAVESNKVAPHFAHIDMSKCSSEAMIHWWYKNAFIERGDTFKISTDKEIEFTCKNFDTEVTYQLENGTYRPDLVIYTECGQEVIFEMANNNKKKVQDYIDKWIELDRIVVEVDIKTLQSENDIKVLKALYYKGKCFNFNKRDNGYYNTVGKLKEELKSIGHYDVEMVRKLDWFWTEVAKYKTHKSSIKEICEIVESFDEKNLDYTSDILKRAKCTYIYKDILNHLANNSLVKVQELILKKYDAKYLEYVKISFGGGSYGLPIKVYLETYRLSEKSGYLMEWRDVDGVLKIIDENFQYNEYSKYKNTTVQLEDEILKRFKQTYLKNLTPLLRKHYTLEIYASGLKSFNSFIKSTSNSKEIFLNSIVKYKDSIIVSRKEYEIIDVSNLDSLYKDIRVDISNYFKLQKPIEVSDIERLNNVVKDLNHLYKDIKLNAKVIVIDEERCSIEFSSELYLFKTFIFSNKSSNHHINLVDNNNIKIKSTLVNYIETNLKESWCFECTECDYHTAMTVGEIIFYIKNGFEKPKKCKLCRQKRKKERLSE